MKRFLIILLLIVSFFMGSAQDSAKDDKIAGLEKKVDQLEQKLAERDSLYESQMGKIQEERQHFISFIESNFKIFHLIVGVGSGLIIFILSFLGVKQGKSLKKYATGFKKDARRELRVARDRTILEISSAINKDPMVVKSVMDERVKDAELKKRYSIRIFYSEERKKNSIKLQLEKFGIERIKEELIKPEELTAQKFQKTVEDVAFIIDFNESNDIVEQLKKELKAYSKNWPCFFYAGKNSFPRDNSNITFNACSSEITIYQNLIDLLRYIDFRKCTKE